MLTKQQMAFLKMSLQIEETDLPEPPKPDFVPRAKGAEYEGEENKTGWRAANMKKKDTETEEEFKQRQAKVEADDRYKTRHFTEEETDAARITADADGVLRDARGNPAQGSNHIYAAELDTGDMILGNQGDVSWFDRGLDEDGKKKPTGRTTTHHTSMLRGEDVAAAGTVSFKDGKITDISNFSGHYKPQFEHLLQLVEHLISAGALLDKTLVDYEGRDFETTHPKAFKLHQKVQPLLAELPADRKMITTLTKKLDDKDTSEKVAAGLNKMIDTLQKKIGVAEKFFAAMRQMGIGPANAFDRTATVDMAFIDKDMSGREAREADSREVHVEEFVTGVQGGKGAHAMRDKTAREALNADFEKYAKDNDLKAKAEEGAKKGQAPEVSQEDWDKTLEEANTAFNDIAESQEYATDGRSLKQAQDDEDAHAAQQREMERLAQAERDRKAREDLSQLMYSDDPSYPKSEDMLFHSSGGLSDDEAHIQPMGKHDNDNSLGPAFVPRDRRGVRENDNNAVDDDSSEAPGTDAETRSKYFQVVGEDDDSSEETGMDGATRSKYFQVVGEDDDSEIAHAEDEFDPTGEKQAFELSEQPAEFNAGSGTQAKDVVDDDAIDLEDIQIDGYAQGEFDPLEDEDDTEEEELRPSDGYVDPDLK